MSNDIELPDLPPLKTVAWMTPIGTVWVTKGPTDDKPLVLRSDAEAAILADRAKRAQGVQEPVCVDRKVYRNDPEHREYLSARFGTAKDRLSFQWQGNRWAYKFTSFDDAGEFDVIYRYAAPAATESKPVQAEAPSEQALNTLWKMFHSGEEVEADDGLGMWVQIDLWHEALEALESITGEEDEDLATSPTVSGVGERDSYEAIWNALHEIDSAAVFLPTFKVNHEGGLEAFTKNIVEAIQAAAIATQPLEQKPGCPKCKRTDGQVCDWCPSLQPEQVEQKPVARVVRHEATVRLEWASVESAHNAKPGPLYSVPQPEQVAQDRERVRFLTELESAGEGLRYSLDCLVNNGVNTFRVCDEEENEYLGDEWVTDPVKAIDAAIRAARASGKGGGE